MKAFLTGGAGFLGGCVLRRLLQGGWDVVALVRPGSDTTALENAAVGTPGKLLVHRGDVCRLEANALEGCDVVFHLASAASGSAPAMFATNVSAMRPFLDAAIAQQVKRFVHVSSFGVLGVNQLPRGATVDESCPLEPEPHRRDVYSYSKTVQEQVAWEAHRERALPLVVIRPGVIYGPGRNFITPRVGLSLGSRLLYIGGRRRVPYTYVENCAAAIVQAGTVAGIEGEAFHIVDDDLPTAGRLVRVYRKSVGKLKTIPIPGFCVQSLSRFCEWYNRYSKGQLPAVLTPYKSKAMWRPLVYANAKAKAKLQWSPEIAFEEGLRRSAEWLREHKTKPSN